MQFFLKRFLLLLISFLIVNQLFAQSCTITNSTFNAGEEITYILSYNWFIVWTEVGEIKLTTSNSNYKGNSTYLITGDGKTNSGWDWFFKVRDIYKTQIDQTTLKPLFFSRDIQEGSYTEYESFEFNHSQNKAFCNRKIKNYAKEYDTLQINACIFDVLSAFTYARNIDYSKLKKDQSFPLTILLDKQLYNISFKYIGIENMSVKNMGDYECLKFSIQLINGSVFKEGDQMLLWATNDKNHLPVYLESPIIIGTVKARVSKVSNNRYPFTSLLKQ
jgi:hypothetical protein